MLFVRKPVKTHSSSTFLVDTTLKPEHEPPPKGLRRDVSEATSLHFPVSPLGGDLSPSSPTRVHRMELLKKGSPKSKALESLRAKIQQQKLERISGRPVTELMHQCHVVRKVCRVTSKGARIVPGTAGVMGLCVRKAYLSPSASTASHLKPDSKGAALRNSHKKTQQKEQLKVQNQPKEKRKENISPTEQSTRQKQNAQELHEYMHRQALERRRKERQMKRKAELEKEKRRMSVHEVLKKQKEALQTVRKQQIQEPVKSTNAERKSGNVLLESKPTATNSSMALRWAQCDAGTGQTECFSEASNPADLNRSQISLAETQKHRVEVIRKMMVSLDARVENEAAQLVIMGLKGTLAVNAGKQNEAADRNKEKESVSTDGNAPKKKEIKISMDQWACPAAETCTIQREQATIQGTSEKSDYSESTDSTSKWSELSEAYSQSQLQRHLSLAQSQQFLREEELRARQHSALFRLREKALWERTQAELAWLEHCKKQVSSEDNSLAEIKRKQEEVVSRLRQEQAEIHHWRNVYKCGRQQRRLLLCHQRDILDIKKSATHFREVLQKQAEAETDTRPVDAAPALEAKSFITKPGIIHAAGSRDKSPGKQGRQVCDNSLLLSCFKHLRVIYHLSLIYRTH
ncbi:hypothetical protein SRHO_G00264790 [Serrasalmus rhombeus]